MPEECPYCSAEIVIPVVERMKKSRLSFLKIFGHSRATTNTAPVFDVNCIACDRKYTLVKFNDLAWIVDQINYETNAIRHFRAHKIDHHVIPHNITGIAFRDKKEKMDVCFKHLETRAYISCVKRQDGWYAVSVEVIRFGQ